MISLHTAELPAAAPALAAGQRVLLSGPVYTARDAAHKRLISLIRAGTPLPFELRGATIYYAGPTPTRPGGIVGSCGPTTSGRMDPYTPLLLEHGLAAMIGKGERNEAVRRAVAANGALYFCAAGGAGALAAQCVTACAEIAFPALGCESVKRLQLREFPLVLAIDSKGNHIDRARSPA